MKLTRSRDDVVVAGVLAGLGEYLNVDPTLIRIGAAILIFFSPFPMIPLYIIAAMLIPKAPKRGDKGSHPFKSKTTKRGRGMNRDSDFDRKRKTNERKSSTVDDIGEDDWSDF